MTTSTAPALPAGTPAHVARFLLAWARASRPDATCDSTTTLRIPRESMQALVYGGAPAGGGQ
ncbi:MAG: hypothetical protein V4515_15230 [Chloroflexota bacterium]